VKFAPLPPGFRFRNGSALVGGQVAYESWGSLAADRRNAILLFTGLSPSAHAASSADDPAEGWWEAFIGPGRALDTNRWFVLCVNSLGSCFGSSGPASIDPETGQAWRLRFPDLTVEDIAAGGKACLEHLGVTSLHGVVGASLGGMSAMAFVAQFPGTARRLGTLSASDAASPVAIALRSVQREAILSDPDWQGGQYAPERPPVRGLRIARKLGTTTYRGANEWDARFGRQRVPNPTPGAPFGEPEFEVERYLEAQAQRFATRFDANCYLYLSRAMDRFQLADHAADGRLASVFASVGLEKALVIGVETDVLFPIGEQARIAAALTEAQVSATFVRLNSPQGHDAFLVDVAGFDPPLRALLS
jgi:homoserine O-acetyltransferase/O-succinyltransferase